MQRITAAVIFLGLVIHFAYLHWFIERPVTYGKIRERMLTPGWLIFDAVLLVAAMYHLLYGCYGIYCDFNPKKETKSAVRIFLWFFGVVATCFGIVALYYLRARGVAA
jgi:succinate dehydrogenase hydrophobic anchor subunit